MVSNKIFFKKSPLPLSAQIIAMQLSLPEFIVDWDRNTVVWTGTLKPTPISKDYTVQITYSLDMDQPEVIVLAPMLNKREDDEIPHVYPGNKLCLFRPRKKEWTQKDLISETIIPWTSLWLYYYEMWHATGKWLGGGEHPNQKRRNKYV